MEISWAHALLVLIGVVAGALNVIAGGGSFLTLPALIDPSLFGLDPITANGTNRVGIACQNVAASHSFWRRGLIDGRSLLAAALPALLGSALGTWAALAIDPADFRRVLASLMVVVTLVSLRRRSTREEPGDTAPRWLVALGFFGVGIYGGFIQAGVGFLILGVLSMAGFDLVRGNAIKVATVLLYTALALALFAWQGHVDWGLGFALAIGTAVGGVVGARLTVLKGDRWVSRVVTVMILVFALRLWLI